MGQNHYAIYLLLGDPNIFVYTCTKCPNTIRLLEALGFRYQHTLYAYSLSCTDGHMYSVPKYFNMKDTNRMIRLVRINNGTDAKIRDIYKEIVDAQTVARKRWWEYYSIKK